MALIKCPECGTGVSDKAESCPRCGYPIAEGGGKFAAPGWEKYFEGKSPEQIEEIKKRCRKYLKKAVLARRVFG